MAEEIVWPVEVIPDAASVFMRAHRDYFHRDGELLPGVFRNHGNGMSVNWDKHASAEETKQQAQLFMKDPHNYAVIVMPVIGVRRIDGLSVDHTPKPFNRAHSDVIGLPQSDQRDQRDRRDEMRRLLLKIAAIALPLPPIRS